MARARYKLLVDEFAQKIRDGSLTSGTRLPTHRDLAKQHKMSLVTASRVYAELESMGLISGETGRGTFVRELTLPPGLGIEQRISSDVIDLNFNYPSLPSQTELFRQSLRQLSSAGDLETLLRYQPHIGRQHERSAVAQYLQHRGIETTSEHIVITSGAQHGLTIAAMSLLKPGDVVVVDALTYPGFKILADLYHFEMVALPMSYQGLDLDALSQLCETRNVKAIYMMPTLHNPMGYVMPLSERLLLAELAKQYDFWIIEDGAYAFLIDNAPLPIAQIIPEKTLYISGFSKSVATGLRVGFMVAPIELISTLERVIRCTTWNTPAILTRLLCDWLDSGAVLQLEAEKRKDAQYRQMIAHEILDNIEIIAHSSSYFIWLPLPQEVRADAVAKDLLDVGISISTAEPFATNNNVPHAIRIALGSVELDVLKSALLKVKQVLINHIDW